MSVIWHDIECGPYHEDVPVWRALAAEYGDPILDVGAGTGRIALDLARLGHRVTALDIEPAMIAELGVRGEGLHMDAVVADARDADLGRRFALVIVPMQTIQLFGGAAGRAAFLRSARAHLLPGGALAAALSPTLEPFEALEGLPYPLPDIREHEGVVYASQPIAVREDGDTYVLERRRETVTPAGERSIERHAIRLDRLGAAQLEREALAEGFKRAGRRVVPATSEYVGSVVVVLNV